MFEQKSNTSQSFVPVKEVRDGIILLKEGGMRSIIMASSLNFALKSTDEQSAILSQFQNFLNSLDFSVQIFVQSRRLDIRPYLALLEDRYKEQTNELMQIQVREYIGFVKSFTEQVSIMSKSFFISVPYSPPGFNTERGIFKKILPNNSKDRQQVNTKTDEFEEDRSQLDQRVSVVSQGLNRCGIKVVQLGTEEVVELLFKIFNPGETEKPIQL
jgi:hypothetical protein